jgi:hypothetical protein
MVGKKIIEMRHYFTQLTVHVNSCALTLVQSCHQLVLDHIPLLKPHYRLYDQELHNVLLGWQVMTLDKALKKETH